MSGTITARKKNAHDNQDDDIECENSIIPACKTVVSECSPDALFFHIISDRYFLFLKKKSNKKTLKRMFGLYFAKKNALIASGYPFSRKDSTRRRLK